MNLFFLLYFSFYFFCLLVCYSIDNNGIKFIKFNEWMNERGKYVLSSSWYRYFNQQMIINKGAIIFESRIYQIIIHCFCTAHIPVSCKQTYTRRDKQTKYMLSVFIRLVCFVVSVKMPWISVFFSPFLFFHIFSRSSLSSHNQPE